MPGSFTIDVAGLPVAATEIGTGRPVVCVHGFGTDRSSWDGVLDGLASLGRVVAIDRPGFGGTPLGADPADRARRCTVEGEADLLASLVTALGEGPAVVAGHSAGALAAVAVALRRPDLVDAMVLESPAVQDHLGPPALVRRLARTPAGQRLGPSMLRLGAPLAARAGLRRSYADRTAADAAAARIRTGMRRAGWADDVWERTCRWRSPGLFGRLGEITTPTLVIAGSRDRIVRPSDVEAVRDRIPGARLTTIAGAGHVPHEERPLEFVATVTAAFGP